MSSQLQPAAKRSPLLALIAGDFISQFGNAVTTIALPWFVLETTGSAALTGIVFVALFLPMPIVTLFGGALVDRVSRTRLSVVADLASGVSIALIPLLHHTVGVNYWQVLLLVFTGAVLDGPGFSARRSIVPELAESSRISLARANSAFQVNWSASVLIGPALGGVLIALVGSSAALWFDAGTFLVSALLVACCVREPRRQPAESPPAADSGGYLDDVWAGLRWIKADRRLTQVLLSASITMTLVAAFMTVIMPVYADAVFSDPIDLGLLVAGFGLGSLLGSLGFGYLEARAAGWNSYLLATVAIGVPLALLALEPNLPAATGLAALVGLAFGPIIPSMDTLIQQRTIDSIRGRVFSTRFALNNAVKLPGLLVIGVSLDAPGLAPTLLGLGVIAVALAALMAVWRVEPQAAPATLETVELGEANHSAGD